jgi:hypothetical protein
MLEAGRSDIDTRDFFDTWIVTQYR